MSWCLVCGSPGGPYCSRRCARAAADYHYEKIRKIDEDYERRSTRANAQEFDVFDSERNVPATRSYIWRA